MEILDECRFMSNKRKNCRNTAVFKETGRLLFKLLGNYKLQLWKVSSYAQLP